MHRQYGINAGTYLKDSPWFSGPTLAELAAVTLGLAYFYPDFIQDGKAHTAEIRELVINLRLGRWASEGRPFLGPRVGTDTPAREGGERP